MRWNVEPFVGAGPLVFGMTVDQVNHALETIGSIRRTRSLPDASFNEYRTSGLPICNYLNGRLRCIDFFAGDADVFFEKADFFGSSPSFLLRELEALAGPPYINFGICYFKQLGISLGNFIDPRSKTPIFIPEEGEDTRTVSAFIKGMNEKLFPERSIFRCRN